jgi:ubiquinone/menaquinone biosynthesis C-methylase UbiE
LSLIIDLRPDKHDDWAMTRRVRLEEVLLGVEGGALLRRVVDGDDDFVAERVAAIRRLAERVEGGRSKAVAVPELDVDDGYAAWAPVYDEMPNALIRAEQPLVDQALAEVRAGRALDAACGIGRHAARLVASGHRTVGVDRSAAMLAIARRKVPQADFRIGDLTRLPLEDGSVDVAVCALALTHLPDPEPAIAELARVVRPDGTIVLADAHPAFVQLQGQALFPREDGFAFVRNYPHLHSRYLDAFASLGLEVRKCAESPMHDDFSQGLLAGAAAAARALWAGIPVVLVWSVRRRQ